MEQKTAPIIGGYASPYDGNPFKGVSDAPPSRSYYLECAAAMKAAFPQTKAATGSPASRITKHGITVAVSGGQITLMKGAMAISVQPDELQELYNDMRECMAQVTTSASYRPGAGEASWPAGVGPTPNEAASAAPDLQGGGGNAAKPVATSSGGNNTSWLDRMRGSRPPTVRGGMDGMMDNVPGV